MSYRYDVISSTYYPIMQNEIFHITIDGFIIARL